MPDQKPGTMSAVARERFLSVVDQLLPAINYGGWEQFNDPETRQRIELLAKYAAYLGFKHPPLSFRITSEPSRSGLPRFCPGTGNCCEVEYVVVNRPYMQNVADVKLPDLQSVSCSDPCYDSNCRPTHCTVYDALCEWRKEIQAFSVEAAMSGAVGDEGTRGAIFCGPVSLTIHENKYMGDVFKDNQGATIVNRSTVDGSFNDVRQDLSPQVVSALSRLTESVISSRNEAARNLLEELKAELGKQRPEKSRLETIGGAIVKALPTISALASLVKTIISSLP